MNLEDCLKQFEELTEQIAPLHAVYGPGGTWILRRDSLKAQLFGEWFDTLTTAEGDPKKVDVEQHVLRDPRWTNAIEQAEQSRSKLYLQYGQRQAVSWMIQQRFYRGKETDELAITDLPEDESD